MIVDFHAHLYPRVFMEELARVGGPHGVGLERDARGLEGLRFEGLFFWVYEPSFWDVEARIADLDQAGVDLQVLSDHERQRGERPAGRRRPAGRGCCSRSAVRGIRVPSHHRGDARARWYASAARRAAGETGCRFHCSGVVAVSRGLSDAADGRAQEAVAGGPPACPIPSRRTGERSLVSQGTSPFATLAYVVAVLFVVRWFGLFLVLAGSAIPVRDGTLGGPAQPRGPTPARTCRGRRPTCSHSGTR